MAADGGANGIDVLHVTLMRADGGGPAYVADLVRAQLLDGLRVAVAVPAGSYITSLLPAEAEVVTLPSSLRPWGLLRSTRSVRRATASLRPTVLHAHSAFGGGVARVAMVGTRARPTVVFQPHAWSWFRFDGRLRSVAAFVERRLARWTDLVVCGSDDELAVGRERGIDVEAIVIDNAVDTGRFVPVTPEVRAARKIELGLDPAAPAVVCVARLVPQKAHQVLLEAWRFVVAQRPDAQLLLVGNGSRRDELMAWEVPNVHWFGARRDPEWFHQLADVSVLSSSYETRALSMLEAMSCESPVVVTAAQGATDAVTGGGLPPAGDVVPVGDAPAFAAALIARLDRLDEPAVRAVARRRVLERYDTVEWHERFRALYGELLGRPVEMSDRDRV